MITDHLITSDYNNRWRWPEGWRHPCKLL